MQYFAVIDLGSNSCRMKITQIIGGTYLKVVNQQKAYVRLSENMGPEKTLKSVPMERTIATLKQFRAIYEKLPDVHVTAVATAAVRQATNQEEFLEKVHDEAGIDFEVISGEREAYLDFLGVTCTLPVGDCLIMDTGGASTELILAKGGKPVHMISMPFGSVTISQKFDLSDTISATGLFDAMTYVEKELTGIDWLREAYELPLICLGGSNRSIPKIMRRRLSTDTNDLPDIHGFSLPAEDACDIMHDLIGMDKEERSHIPGLTESRADVIVGGLIPLILILRVCHISEVICSNYGLREGILFEHIGKKDGNFGSAASAHTEEIQSPTPPQPINADTKQDSSTDEIPITSNEEPTSEKETPSKKDKKKKKKHEKKH
ncbi:MAG: Ppx/GppA family phosphatase [Veillonellaceae bacterium]|nr:Ppx/GppA family phosphatase [Veillonellaceae bacterium]